MSEAAVITPPIQASNNAGGDSGLRAAMQAHIAQEQAPPAEASPKPTETPQDAPSKESVAEHPKGPEKAPESTSDKKKPWDRLKAETPEPAEQSAEPQDGEFPDEAPKAQNAWTAIKKRVKELEAERKNWETERSTWNTEKTTWENTRKELEGKASQWSDEQLQEYQKFKEREAIEYVEQSKQYQEEARAPWDRGNAALAEIAEYSQIDPKMIREALMEPNKLSRHDKMVELLGNSTKSLSEARVEILANQAMQAGDDLHKAAQAHEKLIKDASTKREQVAQQEKAASMKAQEEAKQLLRSAISEVDSGIRVQLKDLVDDGTLSEADLAGGDDGFDMQQDPMDLAFGTRSAHLMPVMAKAIRSLKREIAQLKEDRQARQSARPGVKVNGSPKPGAPVPDLKAAMRAHQQWIPGS